MAKLINGKEVSSKVKEEVRIETEKLLEKGIKPGLAAVSYTHLTLPTTPYV